MNHPEKFHHVGTSLTNSQGGTKPSTQMAQGESAKKT